MSAIPGPNNDGQFLNIPHVLQYTWSQDQFLQSVIKADTDEVDNQFFNYGVNHITDKDLMEKSVAYVVVDDLIQGSAATAIEYGTWDHRIRIYGNKVDGTGVAERLRERFIAILKGGSWALVFGSVCKSRFTGRRTFEATNHYCAQFTWRPTFKG